MNGSSLSGEQSISNTEPLRKVEHELAQLGTEIDAVELKLAAATLRMNIALETLEAHR